MKLRGWFLAAGMLLAASTDSWAWSVSCSVQLIADKTDVCVGETVHITVVKTMCDQQVITNFTRTYYSPSTNTVSDQCKACDNAITTGYLDIRVSTITNLIPGSVTICRGTSATFTALSNPSNADCTPTWVLSPTNAGTLSAQGRTATLYFSPSYSTGTATLSAYCGTTTNSATIIATNCSQVATPAFTPDGIAYPAARRVMITCATSGSTIHYTTNGIDPTESDPVIASGDSLSIPPAPLALTLKAKAWKQGMVPSNIGSNHYRLSGVIVAAKASYSHSLLFEQGGTLWSWGDNDYGQLGNGTNSDPQFSPRQMIRIDDVRQMAGGNNWSVARDAGGKVWTWGQSTSGQFGDGTWQGQRSTPQAISGVSNIVSLATGQGHTLALRDDGTVWGWGQNNSGQLGADTGLSQWDPERNPTNIPVQSSAPSETIAIATGGACSLAVRSNGTVWAWGGWDGSYLGTNVATAVDGLSNIVSAAVGGLAYGLAINSDGAVWTWYIWDWDLLLGRSGGASPAPVPELSNVVQVAAGVAHSLALTADGRLYTWGDNDFGQLGVTNISSTNRPMVVAGITNVVMVSAGSYYNLAVTLYQGVNLYWGWGLNESGDVGNGTNVTQFTPALIHFPFDSDGDGIPDSDEYLLGTDPSDPDQNQDGLLDGIDLLLGYDPMDDDVDGDGFSNALELMWGTDPFDPNSYPLQVCTSVPADSEDGVSFGIVQSGHTYRYQASGSIGFNEDGCRSDADGNIVAGGCSPFTAHEGFICPGLNGVSLVGKIDGTCIALGSSGTFTAPASGELVLYCNDNGFGDNNGSWNVCLAPPPFQEDDHTPPVITLVEPADAILLP